MGKRILCMGSINVDLTMFMDRMPEPAETVKTDNFATFPGGKGGNQAATIGKLGGDVGFFTKLGTDIFSKDLEEKLHDSGVDVSHIITVPGDTSGVAMIRVDKNGQNSISFTAGANAKVTPDDVRDNESLFNDIDILLTSMEIRPDTVFEAVKMAKSKGALVIVDPAPAPENGIPAEVAKLIDYVKPNEVEAEDLTGIHVQDEDSAECALAKLVEQGFHYPIISLGEKGSIAWDGKRTIRIKPLEVDAIDSTAAGDIFIGSFTYAIAEGMDLESALKYANVTAAISTTCKGAQSSIPTAEDVARYM